MEEAEKHNQPEYWDKVYKHEIDNKIDQRTDPLLFDHIIRFINHGDRVLDFCCFTSDMKITMADFTEKKIKNIVPGEQIISHDGQRHRVKNIQIRQYKGQVIKLKTMNSSEYIIATPEHPFYSILYADLLCQKHIKQYRNNEIRTCRKESEKTFSKCKKCVLTEKRAQFHQARNLKKGDFLITPVPKSVSTSNILTISHYPMRKSSKKFPLSIEITDDLMLFLGLWLAEGSILKGHGKPVGIRFCFHISKDEQNIKDIERIAYDLFAEKPKILRNPKKSTTEVYICNKKLALWIYDLCGSGAMNKKISSQLLDAPPLKLLWLLKGFYRGDGHLSIRDSTVAMLKTISRDLINQLYWISLLNNIPARIYSEHPLNKKPVYRLDLMSPEKLDLSIGINYPKNRSLHSFEYNGKILVPIKEIISTKLDDLVYNLEIEDCHSYIVNKMAVHNCGKGEFLRHLVNRRYVEPYGIDQSKIALEYSHKLDKRPYLIDDLAKIPLILTTYPYFDCITLIHSLEHFKEPLEIISKLKAYLKPAGRFIFTLPIEDKEWQEHYRIWRIEDVLHLIEPIDCWAKITYRKEIVIPAGFRDFKQANLLCHTDGTPKKEAIVVLKW